MKQNRYKEKAIAFSVVAIATYFAGVYYFEYNTEILVEKMRAGNYDLICRVHQHSNNYIFIKKDDYDIKVHGEALEYYMYDKKYFMPIRLCKPQKIG